MQSVQFFDDPLIRLNKGIITYRVYPREEEYDVRDSWCFEQVSTLSALFIYDFIFW